MNIKITDIDKLEITKHSNRWSIYFKYDNQRYFLKENNEENLYWVLNKKTMLENGHYYCEELGSTTADCNKFIQYKTKTKKPTLSEIDKRIFIMNLVKNGLAKGIFEEEVNDIKELEKQAKANYLEANKVKDEAFDILKKIKYCNFKEE